MEHSLVTICIFKIINECLCLWKNDDLWIFFSTFNFTVPYLSCIAIMLLILATIVLYIMPIRYLLMLWGTNKFFRRILRPHAVPNNEILDLLSRIPDDEMLVSYFRCEYYVDLDEWPVCKKICHGTLDRLQKVIKRKLDRSVLKYPSFRFRRLSICLINFFWITTLLWPY